MEPISPLQLEREPTATVSRRIAVVIPCYRVRRHILAVLAGIDASVACIYIVDDCCPEGSGDFVALEYRDPRVRVLRHHVNMGVGAAVMTGYVQAVADGCDIIVKIDGDGQMDGAALPRMVAPIIEGRADYTKGNRFYDLSRISSMPPVRVFGNSVLSIFAKFSTGYWGMFDPTNGYTAISARLVAYLPLNRISRRYFFESDMLFRLNTLRAVVLDVPMDAIYGNETSSLRIAQVFPEFLAKHSRNFAKRIFYNYFLRDMSLASLELLLGAAMLFFGVVFGIDHWLQALRSGKPTALGIIMLAALPVLVGLQLLLAFLAHDIASVPRNAVARDLPPPLRHPASPMPGPADPGRGSVASLSLEKEIDEPYSKQ